MTIQSHADISYSVSYCIFQAAAYVTAVVWVKKGGRNVGSQEDLISARFMIAML